MIQGTPGSSQVILAIGGSCSGPALSAGFPKFVVRDARLVSWWLALGGPWWQWLALGGSGSSLVAVVRSGGGGGDGGGWPLVAVVGPWWQWLVVVVGPSR